MTARCALVLALGALAACLERPAVAPDAGCPPSDPFPTLSNNAVDSVDLLLEIDNSNSMTQNQQLFLTRIDALIGPLLAPPDRDGDGVPDVQPVNSLHVGVIDTDLGTPGSNVPGCLNSDKGDDGLLNPIHFGQAEAHHEPPTDPPGIRPSDCGDLDQFPAFITFDSATSDATQFSHDVVCNGALNINGCGLEQQLESIWRALIWNDASDTPGNMSPNAGFLRPDAVLAIVVLSDEDDGSVVDCRYVRPGDPACPDPNALDVYNTASNAWASSDLNLRDYLDQPCGSQDPTWSLDRYVDPNNAGAGFFGLKPGHPERIVFAAITGVPLAGDGFPQNADGTTDWDRLLGTPSANGPDDFCGRNAGPMGESVDTVSAEGAISMRQANADPACPMRVVPACRRRGSHDDPAMPACSTTEQYFAWPARRIVEVARRFDQEPFCDGQPCSGGLVASICENDDADALGAIAQRIQARLGPKCLPAPLPRAGDASTGPTRCIVREYVPAAMASGCDGARGRTPPADGVTRTEIDGQPWSVCDVAQVTAGSGQPGWYEAMRSRPEDWCNQWIEFTAGAGPVHGAITRLECATSPRCP